MSTLELVDTHTHLYDDSFDEDREEVVARALAAGVTRMVVIGAGLASSGAALQTAMDFQEMVATVGVHPHEARDWDDVQHVEIRDMAAHPKVRAIGEIGLDYHYDFSPRPIQRTCFEDQMALAAELSLPVVIHMREAEEDVYSILKDAPKEIPAIVMHCFLGDGAAAERWLALGCLLGVGGAVTFRKMEPLREAVKGIPMDRLLLETDCPYMTPHPHRGKRNEPSYVPLVAATVAEVKGLPVEEVAAVTTSNALRLFGDF